MRRHGLRMGIALTAVGVLTISPLSTVPASGDIAPVPNADSVVGLQGDEVADGDVDNRAGTVRPTERQRTAADQRGTTVRWNRYGTPATLIPRLDVQPRARADQDPATIARDFLKDNRELFRLPDQAIAETEVLVSRPMGQGAYVMLRQRFGSTPTVLDGLGAFGIRDGLVRFVTSTLSPNSAEPEPATISAGAAVSAAATDADLAANALEVPRVRLGAVPMPDAAPRLAYQVVLMSTDQADDSAFTSYVDARTGAVLVREDIVDHDVDNPEWDVFPANPPADYSSRDTRIRWCLEPAAGCERTVSTADTGAAWDLDPSLGAPSETSSGNSARGTEKWDSLVNGEVGTRTSAASPTREYTYPWANQWFEQRCDPAVFNSSGENDIDAGLANLFAGHNRMHDWSYRLGFTEETWNMQVDNGDRGGLGGDPERGNAQAGGRVGGAPPTFPSRNNANQITPPDGVPATTNMFLWQPTPGGFYAPCVDGDYDMSVIGHEYTHAISGRMIAGPDLGWSGPQAGAMNESHSDLFAMEYQFEYGFLPRGDTPFVIGGYVTGDAKVGIRNFDMSNSSLNYSNLGYDLVGNQVHADGEIWSATSFDLRRALIDRYGSGTPAEQRACADGEVPVERCPGNRRWVQQAFDALLLNASGAVSYVDLRDATLAANEIRFGGADLPLLWNVFASRGLGQDAASNGPEDPDPTPSFASPFARNATLRLAPTGQAGNTPVRLFVGDFEGRSNPVADTDPATPLPDTVRIAPGTYTFTVAGDSVGSTRLRRTVRAGERGSIRPVLWHNVASGNAGATATGDGVNLDKLIDDTESTNWAAGGSPVAGKNVVVDLAGNRPQVVSRLQVSALLRPQIEGDADPEVQNRFTALRQFEVLSCSTSAGSDCTNPANFRRAFLSPANAFPANVPRPTAPDLSLRAFRISPTVATHLMIRVHTNQCTGAAEYAGEQHDDPRSTSDCTTGNPAVAQTVRISEFQAFLV